MAKKRWGYVLSGADAGTLDNYVFDDWKHAEQWMGQPIIQDARMHVHAAIYREKRDGCGCLDARVIRRGPALLATTRSAQILAS
jgi:hypothetical protein